MKLHVDATKYRVKDQKAVNYNLVLEFLNKLPSRVSEIKLAARAARRTLTAFIIDNENELVQLKS